MNLYIATLAELKAEIGISDTDDDAIITRLGVSLQGRFDTHCNRRFLYSASEQEILDGGVTALLLRRYPLASVTEIIEDADQEWDSDDALEADDYRLNYKRGKIYYGAGTSKWPEGFQNIRVTYAGGFVQSDGTAATYVDAAELELLRYAFFLQFNFMWRNRESYGVTEISANGASRQMGASVALALAGMTLLPEVDVALQPLRRIA